MEREVIAEITDMCKYFGVTVALSHVDVTIRRGEIRGLVGENGSGKSTIMSILAGIQPATSGKMTYKGMEWKPATSLEASNAGIGFVVQEIGTISNITVAENIFLGDYKRFKKRGIVSRKMMIAEAREVLEEVGIEDIDPSLPASAYSFEQRKLIEIAKAFSCHPDIIIFDETSTSLSENGRQILYRIMRKQREENKSVVFISHDLDELMEVCDTLTVLRDGEIIDNIDKTKFEVNDIKHKMIGREMGSQYYRDDIDGYSDEVVLQADCITTMRELLCLSLELHKGEILGAGGLSECGMHTLGKALYGLEEVVDGKVILKESGTVVKSPETAFNHRMGFVSKNRDTESLEMNASIGANIQSTGFKINRLFGPFLSLKKEKQYATTQVNQLEIKCTGIAQGVKALSGGNKQKVVFGKWIAEDAEILILDCPTRGVDIGVKAAMYRLINDMKKAGKSIIIISEELPELCGMSDRLLILKDGKITGEFLRKDGFDNKKLLECMI